MGTGVCRPNGWRVERKTRGRSDEAWEGVIFENHLHVSIHPSIHLSATNFVASGEGALAYPS